MVKRIVAAAGVLVLIAGVLLLLLLSLPREWRQVHVGMSRAQLHGMIPEFDQPWGDIKADFEYKDCGIAIWRLAVGWDGDRVRFVERELWTKWPERRRVRHIIEQ